LAKYRILTSEELQELEKEFVNFLVLNGIPADDWEKMKKDQEKADRMIELFSDVVFEKILREISYLVHYSKSSIKTFFCDKDEIHLIGLDSEDLSIDLSSKGILEQLKSDGSQQFKTYQASKKYTPNREAELYGMLQNGCVKTEGRLYLSLKEQLEKGS